MLDFHVSFTKSKCELSEKQKEVGDKLGVFVLNLQVLQKDQLQKFVTFEKPAKS